MYGLQMMLLLLLLPPPLLLTWWKQLSGLDPGYGYYVNASKSWLAIKEDYYDTACTLFADTSLCITTESHLYLEAPLGSL